MNIKAFISFSVEVNGQGFVRNLIDITPAIATFYAVWSALRGVVSGLAGGLDFGVVGAG